MKYKYASIFIGLFIVLCGVGATVYVFNHKPKTASQLRSTTSEIRDISPIPAGDQKAIQLPDTTTQKIPEKVQEKPAEQPANPTPENQDQYPRGPYESQRDVYKI
jgi:hypothetical protein